MGKADTPGIDTTLSARQLRTRQLGELLRHCRERALPLTPDLDGARRKPGLRQEDVAALLRADVRHYRDFERGRLRSPDSGFLDQIAAALAMTAAEREALFHLAADRPPPPPTLAERDMDQMRALIDFLPGQPAVVTDMAFDILAWNQPLAEWLINPALIEPSWRNALLWPFTAQARAAMPGIEREYPLIVGRVRLDYLCDAGRNPALVDVAQRLLCIPEAADLWDNGALALDPVIQTLTVHHPVHGNREMRTLSTMLPQQGLRLLTFTPIEQPTDQDAQTRAPRTRRTHGPGRSTKPVTAAGTAPR